VSANYRVWLTVRCRADEVEAIQDSLSGEAAFRYNVTSQLHPADGVLLDAVGDLVVGDSNRAVEHTAYALRCAAWYGAQRRVKVDVYYARMEPESSCAEEDGDFERALRNGDVQVPCCRCQALQPFGSYERLCAACAAAQGRGEP